MCVYVCAHVCFKNYCLFFSPYFFSPGSKSFKMTEEKLNIMQLVIVLPEDVQDWKAILMV